MLASNLLIAQATTFFEQPFPETVEQAPNIVRGRVGMSYSNWAVGSDGTRRIYTYTELLLDETLKGNPSGKTIVIRELGGEKDGVGMRIAGSAQFDRGEEVVVLLNDAGSDGSFDVNGMMMGKYNIERDTNGVEYLVGAGIKETIGEAPESNPEGNHDKHDHNDTGSEKKWTLEAFKQLIQKQAKNRQPEKNSNKNESLSKDAQIANTPKTTTAVDSAPPLQPKQEGVPSTPWYWIITGLFSLLGVGILIAVRKRK